METKGWTRRSDVIIIDRASGKVEYVLGKYLLGGQYVYGADWVPGRPNELELLLSSDCQPHEHSTISVADLSSSELPGTPSLLGKDITSLDVAADGRTMVFDTTTPDGQPGGLWVVTGGDPSTLRKIVDDGSQPLWWP
jgi:hypothetical protein